MHFSQEAQEVRALPKAMRAGEKCEPFKRDWMELVNFFPAAVTGVADTGAPRQVLCAIRACSCTVPCDCL